MFQAMSARKPESGFSLIELLVVMGVTRELAAFWNCRMEVCIFGHASLQGIDAPDLGLLSKAAGGDRPPFLALTRGLGLEHHH